jgi:hypothetical protein
LPRQQVAIWCHRFASDRAKLMANKWIRRWS